MSPGVPEVRGDRCRGGTFTRWMRRAFAAHMGRFSTYPRIRRTNTVIPATTNT